MQPLAWYTRRLRSMSAAEIAWRVSQKWIDLRETLGASLRSGRALAPPAARPGPGLNIESPLSVEGIQSAAPAGWREALIAEADDLVAHRVHFFDQESLFLGSAIDWNRDYKAGIQAPLLPAAKVDYRDYRVTGDCKFVWELSRHHHLVVLGRAYHLSGERVYAEEVARQLQSWLEECPVGFGMNWRSPLELAIRLINWCWALDLVREADVLTAELSAQIERSAVTHLKRIARRYSRYSSANNHLIGEAAGVYIGACCFPDAPGAARLRHRARRILEREILAQTFPDGATREQATGYHLFVLQFFTFAGLVSRDRGEPFAPAFWARLEAMYEFLAGLAEGGDHLPMIGDADDGYVLDLGGRADIVPSYLGVGASLFGRADFKVLAGAFPEPALWLMGLEGRDRFEALASDDELPIRSRAFPAAGYYLLQRGSKAAGDRISVLIDAGLLGFQTIAAHGHADALAVAIRAFGEDVLVDPGTYDYFTYPAYRTYFRSTRAHNTVEIDGCDQSEMLGPFLWGKRATARCTAWEPSENGGLFAGEHDGYTALADPVTHQRRVRLLPDEPVVEIEDQIAAKGEHEIRLHFHLGERCRVVSEKHNEVVVDFGAGQAVFTFADGLELRSQRGTEDPILGWVSRGYHRKTASTTIVAGASTRGRERFTTRIRLQT